MDDFMYAGIPIATLINMLLEVLKVYEYIDRKYIPLISLLLGLLFGVFLFSDGNIVAGIVKGLYLGLMPIGLHEGIDNLKEW